VPMVDFTFFRSRTFLGTSLVAFTVTFAMLASFFFVTLYMQNILGYSPLEAGLRTLPTTVLVIAAGPIIGRLTDRIGPRTPLVTGLLLVAVAIFWQSRINVDTGYGFLVGSFVVLGVGIGCVMSPMSTAAMNAVAREKAGVASGVLTMSRMVGGTFGVAVIGALVTTVGRAKIDTLLPSAPAAVREAFVSALSTGLTVGTVVVLLSAVIAGALITRLPPPPAPLQPPSEAPPLPVPEAVG
jgi:MFS family permease